MPVYKTIKVNITESVVDGNSVQVPCIMEYKPKVIVKNGEEEPVFVMKLTYVWSTWKGSKKIFRGVEVSGGTYGIPTVRDFDVLLALQRIFLKQKLEETHGAIKTQGMNIGDYTFYYTIDGLCKELGYKTPNNTTRNWVRNSVVTLTTSTMRNLDINDGINCCGGLYDVKKKEYVDTSWIVHFFEEAKGYTEASFDKRSKTKAYLRISPFLYDTIVNNYMVYYNTADCINIKNYTAKRIYFIFRQWKGRRKTLKVTMKTLMERIPSNDDVKPATHKSLIKKALRYLNDNEFLLVNIDNDDNVTLAEIPKKDKKIKR